MNLLTAGLAKLGGLIVGRGSKIFKIVTGTVVVDPASIAAQTTGTTAVTISGAKVGDLVTFEPPATLNAGITVDSVARVSADNTAQLRLTNVTGGAIDVASATWRYTLTKFVA